MASKRSKPKVESRGVTSPVDEDEFQLAPLEDDPQVVEALPVDAIAMDPFPVDAIDALPIDAIPVAEELATDTTSPDPFDGAFDAIPVDATSDATADAFADLPQAISAVDAIDAEKNSADFVDEDEVQVHSRRRKFLLGAVPSWLISLLAHVGLILILASITLDPVAQAISILQASMSKVEVKVEEFDLQDAALDSAVSQSFTEEVSVPSPNVSSVVSLPELTSPTMPTMDVNLEALEMNQMTENIIPTTMLNAATLQQLHVALDSRSAVQKSEMLEKFGGTAASEKAVALALKWIAEHQLRDGGWSCIHTSACRGQCRGEGDMQARNAATAMALLPFLGAGQTHLEGQYKETVYNGLKFLINNLDVKVNPDLPYGSWHEPGGRMYSHGLAAITICEAYAMSRDPDLIQPAQLALNYLVYAQSKKDGGWRYEPGQAGDTSVVGWCIMALKSGKMGNLVVPPQTFQRANRFLDLMAMNEGALYAYDKPTADINRITATSAVGLLCRMYMGYSKDEPAMQEGVKFLGEKGPNVKDLYFSYYATQVLRHNGGPVWETWNTSMRDQLIKSQVTEGHAAGSWYFGGKWTNHGGRLYETSLATMILEVYYRHMPLYSEKSADEDDDFQL